MTLVVRPIVLPGRPAWDNGNNPVVLYRSLLTISNITATYAETLFPVTNLANEAMDLLWKSTSSADQYLTATINGTIEVDGIGIAEHNFGSGQIQVSVETKEYGEAWVEVVEVTTFDDDSPILFRFPPQLLEGARLKLHSVAGVKPQAAVMYVGPMLVLQRRTYVGHTPLTYARTLDTVGSVSFSGKFLGRITRSQTRTTALDLKNITPDFYRQYMEPFFLSAEEFPFFFAWRPQSYPLEVGYAWLTNRPRMENQMSNGLVGTRLEMEGSA